MRLANLSQNGQQRSGYVCRIRSKKRHTAANDMLRRSTSPSLLEYSTIKERLLRAYVSGISSLGIYTSFRYCGARKMLREFFSICRVCFLLLEVN